jgi:protein-tyrosine phosphatase
MGGIPAFQGRQIKKGLVYRSGDLHSLTEDEILVLENLDLKTVIDFRSPREIEHRPDMQIRSVKMTKNFVIHDLSREKATWFLHHSDSKGLETLLIDDYRRMVTENQPEFSEMLDFLAKTNDLPLVFHCAAGKDRTGLAAIFFLTVLGVEYDLVLEDYYATNRHNAAYSDNIIEKINNLGFQGELMRPMLEVRPEYLNAAMEVIDKQFGGLQNYVINTLKAEIERLRERYLE